MSYVCYLCLVMYSAVKYYMSNMAGVYKEAVTAYPSGPPGFTPGFCWGPSSSSFFFSMLCFLFCLSSSCVLCFMIILKLKISMYIFFFKLYSITVMNV
jgi:hypothetical protein